MRLFKVAVGNKIMTDFHNRLCVFSPINNKVFGIIPKVESPKELNSIFQNAKKYFYEFKKTSFEHRKNILINFVELLKQKKEDLVHILIWEIAKNKKLALDEVERTISYIQDTINEYENIIKDNNKVIDESIHHVKGKKGTFSLQPLGLVLAITPFNYPLNLLIAKIVPALISGNVVVFKPSTQGSCIASYISTLLYRAGFSNGEISCVIGKGSEIGDALIENHNIDMISFTGSTKVGIHIAKKQPLIPMVLELGGKDAAIVLEDVNVHKVVKEIIKGSFTYNGQRCTSIKRVFVDNKIKGEFLNEINLQLKNLTIGSAAKGNYDITELIDKEAIIYNLKLLEDAFYHGAKSKQKVRIVGNNILKPIVLFNVSDNSKIVKEEQFGPVLPIMFFDTIEQAIKMANNSKFGLQSSIFTKNIDLAIEIANKLEVVTVNINKSSSRSPDIFPFGGIKNSGKGLQGIKESILSMNRIKGIIENN